MSSWKYVHNSVVNAQNVEKSMRDRELLEALLKFQRMIKTKAR